MGFFFRSELKNMTCRPNRRACIITAASLAWMRAPARCSSSVSGAACRSRVLRRMPSA